MVAATGVQQSVVGIARLRRRVEFDRSHGVGQVLHDVSFAKQLSSCPREHASGGIGRVPFRDDVVIGHVLQREARRDEVRRPGIARSTLGMHGVEQAIPGELRMKHESDESALESVVDRMGKCFGNIRIHVRLILAVDQVEEATRVVGEAPAVGRIAHIADARPPRRRHVLIGGTNAPRVWKAHEILHLDEDAAFHNRHRNRVARDLRFERTCGSQLRVAER